MGRWDRHTVGMQGVRQRDMATGRLRRRKSTSKPHAPSTTRWVAVALWLRLSAAHSRQHSLESPARHQNRLKYAGEHVHCHCRREITRTYAYTPTESLSFSQNKHTSVTSDILRDFYCKSRLIIPKEKFFFFFTQLFLMFLIKFLRRNTNRNKWYIIMSVVDNARVWSYNVDIAWVGSFSFGWIW